MTVEQTSLWELLFSGQSFTSIILSIIFGLWAIVLYLFFLKYFTLKKVSSQDNDFLANVTDCLYDHRIEAAKDLCKRVVSPESRIIKKGLNKIEKSPFEMFVAVVNQREIEVQEMRRNLFRFELLAKILFFLGVFGSGISLALFFISGEENLYSENFYTSFFPVSIGALFSLIIYIFKIILRALIYKIEIDLKIKGNKFLEVIAEIK